jgi:spectrin beta
LLDFNALKPGDARYNLEHAFEIAERELGLPSLLDAQGCCRGVPACVCVWLSEARFIFLADVIDMPDEKSIMTYLIGYYNKFAKMEQDNVWQRRLQNAMQFHVNVSPAFCCLLTGGGFFAFLAAPAFAADAADALASDAGVCLPGQIEKDEDDYEHHASDMLAWILEKTAWLQSRGFPNRCECRTIQLRGTRPHALSPS